MSRSKETYGKKEVRNKKEKKRKEKEKRRLEKKEQGKNSFDDMIAWVDEKGQISDTPPDPSKKEEVKAENIEIGVPKDNSEEGDKILTGEIKKFDNSKGFGFIYCSDLRQDVFVHINDCNGPVDAGDKVEFDVEKGVKGLKAINVNPV